MMLMTDNEQQERYALKIVSLSILYGILKTIKIHYIFRKKSKYTMSKNPKNI